MAHVEVSCDDGRPGEQARFSEKNNPMPGGGNMCGLQDRSAPRMLCRPRMHGVNNSRQPVRGTPEDFVEGWDRDGDGGGMRAGHDTVRGRWSPLVCHDWSGRHHWDGGKRMSDHRLNRSGVSTGR